eukprot:4824408-Prymnesium_polylepis.1
MPPWQRRPPSEASAMRFAVKDSWSPDQGWARGLRYGYAGHSKCSSHRNSTASGVSYTHTHLKSNQQCAENLTLHAHGRPHVARDSDAHRQQT